jgi:thiamine phosphate synthase YjbQ (UPF0047 family)
MGMENLTPEQLINALRKGKLEIENLEWFINSKEESEAKEIRKEISEKRGIINKFVKSKSGSVSLNESEVAILQDWLS